jgi:hypothetical protein
MTDASAPAPAGGLPPLPPEALAARTSIEALKADRSFYEKLTSEDLAVKQAAHTHWSSLHKTAYPAPEHISSIEDINNQAAARGAERWNSYIASLKAKFDLSPTQEAEIRAGVVNEDVFARAKDQREQMIRDRTFRTKLLDGDRAASKEWNLVLQILSMRPVPGSTHPGR